MNLWKLPAPALSLLLVACSSTGETSPPPDGAAPSPCEAAAASGIAVTATDVYGGPPYALGYPPYAIDGCLLAYVAAPDAPSNAGALLLRDLTSGEESLLAAADEEPRRPTVAGGLVAWEATIAGRRSVRFHSGQSTETVAGPFDHAGEPRAAEDGVVLTGWLTAEDLGDTDVFLVTPGGGEAVAIATGPGQQRFADVSLTHIAFTDFAEDPDGQFNENFNDLADIVVHDRAKGTSSTRSREGKQAFPLLGADGRVGYLGWGPDHPEPKFSEYDLLIGELAAPGDADVTLAHIVTITPYIRPTARGRLVEWVDGPLGSLPSLFRRPADASALATSVPGLSGLDLLGPSAASAITVLAARAPGGAMILHAVDRPPL